MFETDLYQAMNHNHILEVLDRKYTPENFIILPIQTKAHSISIEIWNCTNRKIFSSCIQILFFRAESYLFSYERICQNHQTQMVSIILITSILLMTHHVISSMSDNIIWLMNNHVNIENIQSRQHYHSSIVSTLPHNCSLNQNSITTPLSSSIDIKKTLFQLPL